MISARQATPGTKLVVSGTWLGAPTSGSGVETVHSTITVRRWEGCGDGTAYLYATTGQCCGRYTSDHMFPETIGESMRSEMFPEMFNVQVWGGGDYFTVENGAFPTHAEALAFVNRTTIHKRQWRIV